MDKALIFIAMAGYMSIIIGIGFYYYSTFAVEKVE